MLWDMGKGLYLQNKKDIDCAERACLEEKKILPSSGGMRSKLAAKRRGYYLKDAECPFFLYMR